MRVFLVITFLSSILWSCQDSAVSKIDKSKQSEYPKVSLNQVDQIMNAQMEFSETEWDFGEILQGDVVEHTYEFTNTGSDPLIISDAKGSCGCTVPEWPRAPIGPGEKGSISIKFDSKGKKGKQNKQVTLVTNMVPSQKVLIVKGQINLKED